jgi:uncharacterized protein (UPF0303 family)
MAASYKHEWYEKLIAHDKELLFDSFTHQDALRLGQMVVEQAANYNEPMVVRILFDDLNVFTYFMPGTTLNNVWWMDKKIRTSKRTGVSSLLAYAQIIEGDRAAEPWNSDEGNYALCGGCFPIKLKSGAVAGHVLISGLAHYCDHQLAIDAVSKFLCVSAPSIRD